MDCDGESRNVLSETIIKERKTSVSTEICDSSNKENVTANESVRDSVANDRQGKAAKCSDIYQELVDSSLSKESGNVCCESRKTGSVFFDELETSVLPKYHDGSDSGVEVNSGVLMGSTDVGDVTPAVSCDSSLVSCCYSSEELASNTLQLSEELQELSITAGDGTSEGGSESSSITGYHRPRISPNNIVRKKGALSKTISNSLSHPSTSSSTVTSRSRTPVTRDRSQSNRSSSNKNLQTHSKTVHISRAATSTSSSPRNKKDMPEGSVRGKGSVSRTSSSKTRGTNSSVPLDDGRWPASVSKSHSMKSHISDKSQSTVMSMSFSSVESKATALEKYATLPRRRRKSAENITSSEQLSSREPSLNRAASLRRKQVTQTSSSSVSPLSSNPIKSIPPYPRKLRTVKTKIYRETSVQTSLLGSDLENNLAGIPLPNAHARVQTKNCGVQVERRSERIENLETQLKESKLQLAQMAAEKEQLSKVSEELKQERITNQAYNIRLRALLTKCDVGLASEAIVSELEKQVISAEELIEKQQQEISRLHNKCYKMQGDLDKSYAAQKMILQQQQEVEAESLEMQDFLQAEKSTLSETLRDLETELMAQKEAVLQKEAELLKQQEECSHLVRISEQRRQEQLSVEAKLANLEFRSRETLLQQGAAVSGASVALTRLGARLDNLVDTLVASYNISEQDLEDVIFHNEAYSRSSGSASENGSMCSAHSSPEHTSSRGTTGFMQAVLNAIRSATTSRSTHTETSSEYDQMLSAEPEPSVFSNRDITNTSSPQEIEKRHSLASICSLGLSPSKHGNEEYSYGSNILTDDSGSRLANSESLQNLSLAILRRQELEQTSEDQCRDVEKQTSTIPTSSLVDQVIEVDNLVTKLLKVVRIIQTTNENAAEQERQQFSYTLAEAEEQKVKSEKVIASLQQEIQELQRKLNSATNSSPEEVKLLQDRLYERETQVTEMGRKLFLTKQLLTDNWSQAMSEVRRQYESIDSALEVLHSVQGIVQQSPALMKLQQDLEETNFHCASTLPVNTTTPDLNANASIIPLTSSTTTINGTA